MSELRGTSATRWPRGRPGPPGLDPTNPFSEGRHYIIDPETGCWVWRLGTSRGYPLTSGGRRAHRVQYAALVGPIPDGHDIHHVCENKACVNPEHLEPKLRGPHRQDHQRAAKTTLTTELVVEIRERAATVTQRGDLGRLAAEYSIRPQYLSDIVTGRRWTEAPGPVRPTGRRTTR
jgi:hypothetical protein